MSAISLSWVSTLKVGNYFAKSLLWFYASHNFGKPGFNFKNSTLERQLEFSVRKIREAHKILEKNGYIKRIPQFDSNGKQISNMIFLNIPQDFIDKFFGENTPVDKTKNVDKSKGGRHNTPGEEAQYASLGRHNTPPYNNNINNNINKNSVTNAFEDQKQCKSDVNTPENHAYEKKQKRHMSVKSAEAMLKSFLTLAPELRPKRLRNISYDTQ